MNLCVESVAPENATSFELPFSQPDGLPKLPLSAKVEPAASLEPSVPLASPNVERRKVRGTTLSRLLARVLGSGKARVACEGPQFAHVRIDGFFASVEQNLNASLRDKPVLVGQDLVDSASPEAKLRGVDTGMSVHDARLLCPEAATLRGNYAKYGEFAERVRSVLEANASPVETGTQNDFYLRFAETDHLNFDYESTLQQLQADIRERTGLRATIGAASTKAVAKIASQQAQTGGLRVIDSGTEKAFLGPLPVELLDGLNRERSALLADYGVANIEQFRQIPKAVLISAFGDTMGQRLWQNARGLDCGESEASSAGVDSILREVEVEGGSSDWLWLESQLEYLSERVATALRNDSKYAQAISLRVSYADGYAARQSVRLTRATSDEQDLFVAAEELLVNLSRGAVAIRQIEFAATVLPKHADPFAHLLPQQQTAAEPSWKLAFFWRGPRESRPAIATKNRLGLANPCLSR